MTGKEILELGDMDLKTLLSMLFVGDNATLQATSQAEYVRVCENDYPET
jgi:hypothetical protein